jgi:tripartite-type tricarboxylate transporter receptor subunit TctC
MRTILRRIAAVLVAIGTAGSLAAGEAKASPVFSDWPSRGVKFIVPFPPGSANDIVARLYADALAKRWLRPVVVENRAGADAIIGGGAFANAKDDHTLLYGTASMITVNPLLQPTLPYDPVLDLVPVAPGASSILTIAIATSVPAQTLKELVELARAKPNELSWGAGPSLPFFVFAATVKRHRLNMVHIPYRDAATPVADLGEGRLQVLSNSLQANSGPVSAGKARFLAVTSPRREPLLPDVPTVAEAGFPEMEIEGLSGLFGWRGIPPELSDRIAGDMRVIAADAQFVARVEASGQRVLSGTPAEFAAAIGRQRIRVQQIMHIIELKQAMK